MTDVYGFNSKDVARIGRTVRTVERAAPAVFRGTVAPAVPNVRLGKITDGLGTDEIFRGNLYNSNMDEVTSGPGSDIEIICCASEIPNVEIGKLFMAVKKGQYWRCIGIYSEFATSSDHPSSEDWSSEALSSAYWSSAAEPSSAEPSSTALSSAAEPSSAEPSSGLPSSAALSSGAEPSSAEPSSNALSSGAEPSSAEPSSLEPSSAAPSSLEPSSAEPSSLEPSSATPSSAAPSSAEPSSNAPSSGSEPSSNAPSSGFPSSGTPSSNQSSQGSTGLSSAHPSSDAVSSGDWYECPDTITIMIKGVVRNGDVDCWGSEPAESINGIYTLTRTTDTQYHTDCYYTWSDSTFAIEIRISQTLGYIHIYNQWASGDLFTRCYYGALCDIHRGETYANETTDVNACVEEGHDGTVTIY